MENVEKYREIKVVTNCENEDRNNLKGSLELYFDDIHKVIDDEWLTDNHLDAIMPIIAKDYPAIDFEAKRPNAPQVLLLDTKFYAAITSLLKITKTTTEDAKSIRKDILIKLAKGLAFFEATSIIFPVSESKHWLLAVIRFPVIFIFDSVQRDTYQNLAEACYKKIQTGIRFLPRELRGKYIDPVRGTHFHYPICPKQPNSFKY